jgi:hypothetical protein
MGAELALTPGAGSKIYAPGPVARDPSHTFDPTTMSAQSAAARKPNGARNSLATVDEPSSPTTHP